MTDEDREMILKSCAESRRTSASSSATAPTPWPRPPATSASACATDKTVVLTGAMVPYTFGSSDGLFNLGSALAFVQTLPPGVYVVMNGRCFTWDDVRKNRSTGHFETTKESSPPIRAAGPAGRPGPLRS